MDVLSGLPRCQEEEYFWNFDESDGFDDFVLEIALLVHAHQVAATYFYFALVEGISLPHADVDPHSVTDLSCLFVVIPPFVHGRPRSSRFFHPPCNRG